MAIVPAVFADGRGMSPEEVERQRQLARLLTGDATPKITHWAEGLAHLANSAIAGFQRNRADKAEREGRQSAKQSIANIFSPFPTAPDTAAPAAQPAGGGSQPAGVPEDYFSAIRAAESGGNDSAKNPNSSATGRYQFIESTWNNLAKKYPDLDLTPDGRTDPDQQERAIRAFTADNAGVLSGAGIPITGGNLYAAHFLGADGARKVLTSAPGSSVESIVGKAVVSANPFLRGMSVSDFQNWATKKGGSGAVDLARRAPNNQVASLDPSVGLPAVDPYSRIPAVDGMGQDQRAKFRAWNSDPRGNEAANMASIDPALAKVVERAKQIAGTDFVIGSGRRDADQQKVAVANGWSGTMDSDHLHGGAADLWPVDANGAVVFDPGQQQQIVAAMRQAAGELGVDLDVGADWKRKDTPHFAVANQTPLDNAPVPTARPGEPGAVMLPEIASPSGLPPRAAPAPAQQMAQVLAGGSDRMSDQEALNALGARASTPQDRFMNALGNEWLSDGDRRMLMYLDEQRQAREKAAAAKAQQQAEWGREDSQRAEDRAWAVGDKDLEYQRQLERDEAKAAADAGRPTDDMREYNFAREQGFEGSFEQWQLANRRAGASSQTVTVNGQPADGNLREALDKETGKLWNEYAKQGAVAGSLTQDMAALDELINVAPQGPITGRLAQAFPGFSSAGDAFQSIITRVAPSLRVPGSGATSDIEYEGMLRSLPSLQNKPEANRAISGMMKAKAALNMERSDIIGSYRQGQIDATQAQQRISDIDRRSIMSPDLKQMIEGLGGGKPAAGGVPEPGLIEDGYRFKGGNPADPASWEKVE